MNKKFILFISGIVLTITGLVLGLSSYIDEKINIAYDTMNSKISTIEPEQEQKQEETEEQEEVEDLEHYIGYLEIPKINFNRGFYSKNSEFNNVELNIQVLSNSSYPDTKNGNLIIAAHSGDAYNSYFTDLKYLSIDDDELKSLYLSSTISNALQLDKESATKFSSNIKFSTFSK